MIQTMLPQALLARCIALLPYPTIVRSVLGVCKAWRALRGTPAYLARRAEVDEHALVVCGWTDSETCVWFHTYMFYRGGWYRRADARDPEIIGPAADSESYLEHVLGPTVSFRGDLVTIGPTEPPRSTGLAYNFARDAWRRF